MGSMQCTAFLFYFGRLSNTANSIIASICLGIAVITSSVNLALIVAMFRTKQAFSNTSNALITCVSIIDSLNGALSLPLYSYVRFTFEELKSCALASVGQVISMFLAYLSFSIVILIAIDRYLHMQTSLAASASNIAKLFNGKWIILPLTWAALFSMLAAVSYLVTSDWKRNGSMLAIGLITIAKLIIIPGVATLYITGYIRVRKFVRKNPVYNGSASDVTVEIETEQGTGSATTIVMPRYVKNLQKTVLLLVVSILFTYIPYNIANIVHMIYFLLNKQTQAVLLFYDIATILFVSSFTLNSLIIFKMNRKIRNWIARQIRCCTLSR